MPAPISSNNSSVYDPSTPVSRGGDCDPSNATCSSAPSQQAASPSVTIPEVHIDGDAGKQELIKRLEARNTPSCATEAKNAGLTCALSGATALGGVVASTCPLGFVAGFLITTTTSAFCGKDLRALYDCETQ